MNRLDFAKAFLSAIGADPENRANQLSVLAWSASEFGDRQPPNMAKNNPLATTYEIPGDRMWNSASVRVYATFDQGVHANSQTLLTGAPQYGYQPIMDALRAGVDAHETAARISASSWGSHPTNEIVDYVNSRFDYYAGLSIGDDVSPIPAPVPIAVGHIAMPTLSQGATGDAVRTLQTLIRAQVDGQYGPRTKQIVEFVQGNFGLVQDGICGDKTWTSILQKKLNIPADGIYGPQTTNTVIAFQRFWRLTPDGIAGQQTFNALALASSG
jgi:peptidoglycan hydrolase-like protein with peptidoglycan-binding domain